MNMNGHIYRGEVGLKQARQDETAFNNKYGEHSAKVFWSTPSD